MGPVSFEAPSLADGFYAGRFRVRADHRLDRPSQRSRCGGLERDLTCMLCRCERVPDRGIDPGTAFTERRFHPPGWLKQFHGRLCDARDWCAALTVDSLSEDPVDGITLNPACRARSVAGSSASASCYSPDPARPSGRRTRCNLTWPRRAADQLPGRLAELGIAGDAVYDALVAAGAAGHRLPLATRDRRATQTYQALDADLEILPHRQDQDSQPGRVSPQRGYPAGGGCWPVGRSLPVSRSATNTFCSMCQSSGCLAIPSSNTLASCWVMAAIFSCRQQPNLAGRK